MHEIRALSALLKQTSISSPSAGQHRRGSASLDTTVLHRHRRVYSKELSRWHRNASWIRGISQPSDFGSVEEDDEDLRQYRQEVDFTVPNIDKEKTHKVAVPTTIADGDEEDLATPLPETNDAPDPDVDEGSTLQADRVAKQLLNTEFNLFLGSSEPPREVVDAVCKCLEEISLSIRSARSMGVLPPVTTAAQSAESASPGSFGHSSQQQGRRSGGNRKKRPMGYQEDDDEEFQDDEGQDGFGVASRNDTSHRKRPKVEQYPCPFRKRSPHRFNCREWEFCARAPFKTMSELKKHIIKYHQQQHEPLAYVCPRCHEGFVRAEELKSHFMAPRDDVCDVKEGPTPPSEIVGITPRMMEKLRSRMEHFDWDKLWRALFPDDLNVPDPDFEPIVELHEVNHEYSLLLPEFSKSLASIIRTLLPGTDVAHLHLLQRLNDNLDRLFSEFFATTFDKARTNASGPTNPQAQRAATDTPSPAPSQASSVPNSQPASRPTKTTNPRRPILPNMNPAHRLSGWSSTDTASSSARYSTSASSTSLGQSNRESMVSDVSTLSSNMPPLPPTPVHHHHRLQHTFPIHPSSQAPLRESSPSTLPSTRLPSRNPPPRPLRQRPTTQSPLLQELTLTTHMTNRRHGEPRQEEPTIMAASSMLSGTSVSASASASASPRDPHDSAVSGLDIAGCCFKCLDGMGDGLCRCGGIGGGSLPFVGGAAAVYGQDGGHEMYHDHLQGQGGGDGYLFDLEGLGPEGLEDVMMRRF
ncbi:hypothetical protein F5144DRAFT_479210 [Chaetomium tenue]|uniref:Uncharacterized protein n=1 Tax=Chaetomium tenue TaxID=1854479 RepID=A0ACB7PNH4_9PEZI|nr:hypothetical protein F5144DRAFT_479210 [Chaetomium globosum]